ncbi:MAG: SH3 domain-containing protein [Oscillospiraceae bacterium]|nr:SH3 domain-containing protein [Oscillospiraceae bacterium]
MNFSVNAKFRKILSLVLVFVMMTTLFAGCKKDDQPEDTSEAGLNLDLTQNNTPTETQTEPPETTAAPEINENTATVTSQLNIRSSPSTEATVVGNLYAGDKVEISRREEVTGIDWAYIISPTAGWIVMEFVEMDIPTEEAPQENTSTPAGNGEVTAPTQAPGSNTNTESIKGVINANGLNIRSEASKNGNVQGAYNKGDVVTILETKNGWGRTNKGWISMDYVTTTSGNTTTNTNTNTNTNSNVSGNGNTTVQLRGVVRVNELNIRASASTDSDRVGMYTYGDRVEVLEKSGSWGRTKKGWIHLDYVYQDGTTGKNTISNATITGNGLNIRQGPGTGYDVVGSYNSGDKVTILEQFTYNGTTWGCTNKGWISMQYVNNGASNAGTNNNTTTNTTTDATGKTGTIFASGLNIRSGAGTGYAVVGSLDKGDKVTILDQTTVNGTVWGKIATGWISMDYVSFD